MVAWSGVQAGAVYCLVRGELEVREPPSGRHLCFLRGPGEVLGESALPFATHKLDVVAAAPSEMIRITPVSAPSVNKTRTVGERLGGSWISLKPMQSVPEGKVGEGWRW